MGRRRPPIAGADGFPARRSPRLPALPTLQPRSPGSRAPMPKLMRIAVIGHTNAGKTAVVRTLARLHSFGQLNDLPGTTRENGTADVVLDGTARLRFLDSPGFQDPVGLTGYLQGLSAATLGLRIAEFLRGPEAKRSFDAEAKAMTAAIDADAILYVVDTRESPLPKFQYEIDMLSALGKPVVPVRNYARHRRARVGEWNAVFAGHGWHTTATFDAVTPEHDAEHDLYEALARAAPEWRHHLDEAMAGLVAAVGQRRDRASHRIAALLTRTAAARDTISREDFAAPDKRDAFVQAFKKRIGGFERDCVAELLGVYGFRHEDADVETLAVNDRWAADLFNPETLREAGTRLTGGAAVGAGVGIAVDLAFAGLSLGAGAAIGAAIGGAASQGMTQFGRKIYHKVRGIEEISAADDVLAVMATHMLRFVRALEHRSHAAQGRVALDDVGPPPDAAALLAMVEAARPARNYPNWAESGADGEGVGARRKRIEERMALALRPLLDEPGAGAMPPTLTERR
ncbi:DUF3482 domain-containing protein [Oxalobacteraceae bacterium OM1]|nr:DUF3482 domain-containing protein [Oxalobacteraceae bacterium OM1]